MAQQGHATDEIVAALIADAKGDDGFNAAAAMTALEQIGYPARAATPLFEKRLANAKVRLAAVKDDKKRKPLERTIRGLEKTLRQMTQPPTAPKPPRKRKKKRNQ